MASFLEEHSQELSFALYAAEVVPRNQESSGVNKCFSSKWMLGQIFLYILSCYFYAKKINWNLKVKVQNFWFGYIFIIFKKYFLQQKWYLFI